MSSNLNSLFPLSHLSSFSHLSSETYQMLQPFVQLHFPVTPNTLVPSLQNRVSTSQASTLPNLTKNTSPIQKQKKTSKLTQIIEEVTEEVLRLLLKHDQLSSELVKSDSLEKILQEEQGSSSDSGKVCDRKIVLYFRNGQFKKAIDLIQKCQEISFLSNNIENNNPYRKLVLVLIHLKNPNLRQIQVLSTILESSLYRSKQPIAFELVAILHLKNRTALGRAQTEIDKALSADIEETPSKKRRQRLKEIIAAATTFQRNPAKRPFTSGKAPAINVNRTSNPTQNIQPVDSTPSMEPIHITLEDLSEAAVNLLETSAV